MLLSRLLFLADKCHKYSPIADAWYQTTRMRTKRYGHIAIPLNQEEIWILGGIDESGRPQVSSEIFRDDSFIDGPALPEPMVHFCGFQLNSTHHFVGMRMIGG